MKENLKALRKNEGITQESLAKQIGVNISTYKQYETDRTEPNIETLIKIADFFDVSLDYLCGRQNNKLLFVDSLSQNKKALIETIKGMSEEQTLIAIGSVAQITGKPIDSILRAVDNTTNKNIKISEEV